MRKVGWAATLLVLAAVPLWAGGSFYINIVSQILIAAIFALGLDILVGYAGLISLGHAGLFGVAAYTVAILLEHGFGHSLAIIAALHERWVALLESLSEGDFQRGYNHPENGRQDLATVVALYAWHSRHHTAHITSLRSRKDW